MNMLTYSKRYWNQHGTSIILFSNEFSERLIWKKLALVWSELLRLFVKILTAGDKYWHRKMQKFPQQFQTPLSQKEKRIFAFPKCAWNLERFDQKYEYPGLIISEKYWFQNSWLLKRRKGRASEHHSVINVLPGTKHCWNQHGTSIVLFSHELDINWVGKSLL